MRKKSLTLPFICLRHNLNLLLLGATPERAEFEASIDQDSEPPSIMDEDEWTDRNFGGNSLIIINDEEDDNNTSEDR